MADLLVLDIVEKGLLTDQIVLTIGYDIENLTDENRKRAYKGEITYDHYGRAVPKHAHGTHNLPKHSSSTKEILKAVSELFDKIVNPSLLIRRINIAFCRVMDEESARNARPVEQIDIFSILEDKPSNNEDEFLKREKKMQLALLDIKGRFGKNAVVRGMNLEEGATAIDRNVQIGGHKA